MSRAIEEYKTIYVPMDAYDYEVGVIRGTIKPDTSQPTAETIQELRREIVRAKAIIAEKDKQIDKLQRAAARERAKYT